jgi:hypothetical protein
MAKESFEHGEIGPEEIEKYQGLVARLRDLPIDDCAEINERAAEFSKENRSVRKYALWHYLIGSTIPEGTTLPFDGDDHVVRDFVDDLAREFLSDE